VEEAGFELSVPHDTTKVSRPLRVASSLISGNENSRREPEAIPAMDARRLPRDQQFESDFLQRRVYCEVDLLLLKTTPKGPISRREQACVGEHDGVRGCLLSREFVYMVNGWLTRDSLFGAWGGLRLGAWDPPQAPRMKGGPVLHLEHTRRGVWAGPPPPELVSTVRLGGYSDRSNGKATVKAQRSTLLHVSLSPSCFRRYVTAEYFRPFADA
jgi:hypothetical protein